MKNIAPNIFRQRLLIEGFYTIDLNKEILENYLLNLAQHLNLRTYGKPIENSIAIALRAQALPIALYVFLNQ
jgi:hypothetical protein